MVSKFTENYYAQIHVAKCNILVKFEISLKKKLPTRWLKNIVFSIFSMNDTKILELQCGKVENNFLQFLITYTTLFV